jgi:hypothetical protein
MTHNDQRNNDAPPPWNLIDTRQKAPLADLTSPPEYLMRRGLGEHNY